MREGGRRKKKKAMSSNARRRKKNEEEGHVLKGERRKCSENKYIVHVGLIGLKLKFTPIYINSKNTATWTGDNNYCISM